MEPSHLSRRFADAATAIAHFTGRPVSFLFCCFVVIAWAATGPVFAFSDTWQLIINTGTTIVTFLMVFLIQNTQSRDGAAIQAKLDELIRASTSENRYIGIEGLTEEELVEIKKRCQARANRDDYQPDQTVGKANQEAADAAPSATT